MNLEEIIDAAANKIVNDMIEKAIKGSNYDSIQNVIERRISDRVTEALLAREGEIRQAIADQIATMELSMKINSYVSLEKQ